MDHGTPGSFLTLTPGTDVVTSDGETVGKVEHVLADEQTQIFDGVVIDTRTGPGGLRFVDAPQVEGIYAHALVLTVAAAQVDALPEPSASPGVIESHGEEDSDGELQGKLRRAWDFVSGRY